MFPNPSPVISRYMNALVYRLPDTVLSDIFLLVKSASPARGYQSRMPFALACVSCRWRVIALSTSALWNCVDVLLPAERAVTHLRRSRQVPIQVWLDVFRAGVNAAVLEDAFRRLNIDMWPRVRCLVAMLDYERPQLNRLTVDTLNTVFNAGHTGFFHEITLAVIAKFRDSDNITPSNELITPSLVKLSLNACHFRIGSNDSELVRWGSSIPLLKLEEFFLSKIQGILFLDSFFIRLDMPNLRILKFGAVSLSLGFFARRINWGRVFRNPKIEKLMLEDFSSEAREDLITHIDKLVNLKELEILPDGALKSKAREDILLPDTPKAGVTQQLAIRHLLVHDANRPQT
ncbi:hypothetical protein FRC07_000237 [Ceratobasidium sp. 392]|nr:hypothetical protein FRC07_000237 [Ceratobasidium sp. 392]